MTARFEARVKRSVFTGEDSSEIINITGYVSHKMLINGEEILLEVPELTYLLKKHYQTNDLVVYGAIVKDVYGNICYDDLYNTEDCFVATADTDSWWEKRLNLYEEWIEWHDGYTSTDHSSGRQPRIKDEWIKVAMDDIREKSLETLTKGIEWKKKVEFLNTLKWEDLIIPVYRCKTYGRAHLQHASMSVFLPMNGKKKDYFRKIKNLPEEIEHNGQLFKIIKGWLECGTEAPRNQSSHIPIEARLFVSNGCESFWLFYYLWC